ncbi:phage major capsid protein [Bradyrhizobium sp. JYMT SZCCT0428]|uniref:phage major capsid protein n=1 Tax=Bradyrhizobium sp. JYMT SZCCT0428 TaxID=2807673 RepID=UPI001BAD6A50|nr:phage major capsid protein [Bradyrhizobium sp. JYMT SZCCT0428]MBR1149068.1 phage major capsid protein [Bradyrhizobium sp. JYMT SZCCT0428]
MNAHTENSVFNRWMPYGRLTAFRGDEKGAALAGAWLLGISGNERCARFAEERGMPIVKAETESLNVAGGFLVPNPLMRVIIAQRELRGAFRACAGIAPMTSDTGTMPRRTGGLTAVFAAEAATLSESQNSWDNVALTAKKLALLARSSSELDEDALIDWGEWFAVEMSYAFASKEDDCGFNGDGSGTYGGIRGITQILIDGNHNAGKVSAASGHDTFAEIDNADLANLIGKLPAFALPGARWFCSQMGFATVLCRLAGTAGGIIMQNVGGRLVPTFLGFPVQITQVLPQVTTSLTNQVMLLFGDLSMAAMLGERRGVVVHRSTGRYLDQDQIAWRGTERVDIVCHDLGDNTTAGPIVGLVGTA